MAKSPLDMLNMFGKAAHAKAQKPQVDADGDMDGDKAALPGTAPKMGGNPKAKQAAAIGAKMKGKQLPPV